MTQCHTLIISDLHLGARISRTEKIISVLEEARFKRLIINGDLFDSDTTSKFSPGDWGIIAKLASIAEQSEVLLVGGNHGRRLDLLARKMGIEIVDHHIFTLGNKRFLCLHGDEFDMYIKNLPMTSDIFTRLYYVIQRFGGKRQHFSMVIKRLSKQVLGISRRQQRLALKRGRSHDANVIICSHTHIPHSSEKNGVLFLNSGSFCDDPSTYITVDKNGSVKLNAL
jgi:predicted phosphodiesterase